MYTVFLTGGIGSGKSTVARIMAEHGARVIDTDALAREVLDEPQVKLELARRFGEDVLTWPEGFDMAWALAQVRDGDRAWDDLVAAYGAADSCEDVSEALSRLAREPLDPVGGMCCGTADFAGVNRALLAERAFATPEDTAALNAITHPRIFARLGELLTESPCTGTSAGVVVVEIPLIEASGPGALDLADEIVAVSCPRELRRLRAQGRGMDPEDFGGRDARQIADEERARIADAVIVNDGDARALAAAVDAWWQARSLAGWRGRSGECAAVTVAPRSRRSLRVAGLKSPAVAFVGRHNSGKTTLAVKVIAELVARGVDVGSVKHHGHVGFDVDVPGKDSWRHREAGANEVAVCSPDRMALIRGLDAPMEASELVNLMRPHDVVVVEGYRHSGVPAIEIMRSGNERDVAAAAEFVRATAAGERFVFDPAALGADADRMPDDLTVGVASDISEVLDAARSCGLEAFSLDDAPAIASYIMSRLAV